MTTVPAEHATPPPHPRTPLSRAALAWAVVLTAPAVIHAAQGQLAVTEATLRFLIALPVGALGAAALRAATRPGTGGAASEPASVALSAEDDASPTVSPEQLPG
jgi:hypothetical protein